MDTNHATVPEDDERMRLRWREVGERLREARTARGWSKRAAARAAGFSDMTWRQLEEGGRQLPDGGTVVANPRDDNLMAAARAVGLDPAEIFALVGRPYHETGLSPGELEIHERIDRLERRVSALTALVKELL